MNTQKNAVRRTSPEPHSQAARLIGWLVTYASESAGKAHEIRSGRSFIGSRAIGDEPNLVLDSQDISSPHAALNASPRHRVMVQDVFSRHGTFITKGSSNQESAVHGPVELEHGDWIRIGEGTRFQVCLIDGPSSK